MVPARASRAAACRAPSGRRCRRRPAPSRWADGAAGRRGAAARRPDARAAACPACGRRARMAAWSPAAAADRRAWHARVPLLQRRLNWSLASPYCEEHAKRAYVKLRDRRERTPPDLRWPRGVAGWPQAQKLPPHAFRIDCDRIAEMAIVCPRQPRDPDRSTRIGICRRRWAFLPGKSRTSGRDAPVNVGCRPIARPQAEKAASSMPQGTVKWFQSDQGRYGFVAPDTGGKDIFVHISAVQKAGAASSLSRGQKIGFEVEQQQNGRSAAVNLSQRRTDAARLARQRRPSWQPVRHWHRGCEYRPASGAAQLAGVLRLPPRRCAHRCGTGPHLVGRPVAARTCRVSLN